MSESKSSRAAEIETAIRRGDAEAETGAKLDKLLSCVDSLAKGMEGITSRMDALEATGKGDAPGDPADLAADANDVIDRHSVTSKQDAEMADIQARADSVAGAFGEAAPRPMLGETPMAYRRRLLRPFKHHSKQFGNVELEAVTDPQVFAAIETTIYADALSGSKPPLVVEGHLRKVATRDETGRTHTKFYGRPSVWMNRFGGSRMAVSKFLDTSNRRD